MKNCTLCFLVLFTRFLYAEEPVEIWECRDAGPIRDKVLVKATVFEGRTAGEIEVAGVIYRTMFTVQGFERRWDFMYREDGTFGYAFVINPNGNASYYDFGEETHVKPSILMHCREPLGN